MYGSISNRYISYIWYPVLVQCDLGIEYGSASIPMNTVLSQPREVRDLKVVIWERVIGKGPYEGVGPMLANNATTPLRRWTHVEEIIREIQLLAH